jgi:hypothetical protein
VNYIPHVQAGTSHFGAFAMLLAFIAGFAASLGPTSYALAPAVVGYGVGPLSDRRSAISRASSAALGILVVSAATGAIAGGIGEAAITWFGRYVVALYAVGVFLLALLGLRLSGLVSFRLAGMPGSPAVHRVPTAPEAFVLGGALAIAACPACTPLLLGSAAYLGYSAWATWAASRYAGGSPTMPGM